MVRSAVVLMFLEADAIGRGEYPKQVTPSEITDGVEAMLQRARIAQLQKVLPREPTSPARKTAEARSASQRVRHELPSLDQTKAKKKPPRNP